MIVDIGGLAELADVPYETAMTWRRRAKARAEKNRPAVYPGRKSSHPPLPEPAGYVSGSPWWWRPDLIDWLTVTDRITADA